ncbi:hypothetical protein Naga_100764g1, partial [Nannochloropsis gaditana]
HSQAHSPYAHASRPSSTRRRSGSDSSDGSSGAGHSTDSEDMRAFQEEEEEEEGKEEGGRGRRREVDFLLLSTGGTCWTMSLRERGEGGIGCAEAVKGDRAKEETSLRER